MIKTFDTPSALRVAGILGHTAPLCCVPIAGWQAAWALRDLTADQLSVLYRSKIACCAVPPPGPTPHNTPIPVPPTPTPPVIPTPPGNLAGAGCASLIEAAVCSHAGQLALRAIETYLAAEVAAPANAHDATYLFIVGLLLNATRGLLRACVTPDRMSGAIVAFCQGANALSQLLSQHLDPALVAKLRSVALFLSPTATLLAHCCR